MASVPSAHRAASLPEKGGTHTVVDRPTPSVGPDELLIQITATAINPVDWKIRDYGFFIPSFPAVLGSDAAGVVAQVGSNATNQFQIGERVFFQGILGDYDGSTFQQFTKIPAVLVAKTPANVTDDEAAGVSLTTVAAVTGLYDKTGQGLTPPWEANGSKVGAGHAAIVLGGSSSVGQCAIQLARLSGFERIITNSSIAHKQHLESLGATTVLDRSKSTAKDFKEAAGSLKVAFVQDGISTKETQTLGVEILQEFEGGNVIIVGPPNEDAAKLGGAQIKIKPVMGMGSNPDLRYLSEPLMRALGGDNGWLATKKYLPNRPEVIPGGLSALEEALNKNKKGVSGVKLVIRPNDK